MIITWAREAPILYRYLHSGLDIVARELRVWEERAAAIPTPELSEQALASIRSKRFHCQGGAIYAQYSSEHAPQLTRFIVAVQTISDYLDNLCDRLNVFDEDAFRRLHEAMLCAVDPERPTVDYYEFFPFRDDGGYLDDLVAAAREVVRGLPGYAMVQTPILDRVRDYNELQVLKHLELLERNVRLRPWATAGAAQFRDVLWWEFAAATGSTLAVFCLAAYATSGRISQQTVDALLETYFPWVCGIHILLDYFIDQKEDQEEGDLNFVSYYADERERRERMGLFTARALERSDLLPDAAFHRLVIQGLLAMYLSDPKARRAKWFRTVDTLLSMGGIATKGLFHLCRSYRERGVL